LDVQFVTITCSTSGATIRYTTDGSEPSETNGSVYSAPVDIEADTTLKAIAYKTGYADSNVTSEDYIISLPPIIDGVVLDLDSTVGVDVDESNNVTAWHDQSDQANTAAPGTPPLLVPDGWRTGIPEVSFTGSELLALQNGVAPVSSSPTGFQMAVYELEALDFADTFNFFPIGFFGDFMRMQNYGSLDSETSTPLITFARTITGSDLQVNDLLAKQTPSTLRVLLLARSDSDSANGEMQVYITDDDGNYCAGAIVLNAPSSATSYLGGQPFPHSNPTTINFARILYANSYPDDSLWSQIKDYFFGKYLAPEIGDVVVCDGDSLTFTEGVDPDVQYPQVLQGLFSGLGLVNGGLSGDEAEYMVPSGSHDRLQVYIAGSGYKTSIPSYVRPTKKSIYILWAGTNDLATGHVSSAQDVVDSLSTIATEMAALGYIVCVCTMIDRGTTDIDLSTYETLRADFNTKLRAQYSGFASYLIDFALDSRFGPDGASDDSTFYGPDKVHLTDAGRAAIAALAQPTVAAILS